MAAVLPTPNRPPFSGGVIVPSRVAGDVRGADADFGGKRGPTPMAGVVSTGPPRAARPNRGSNITIPMARLVHLTKKRDWAATSETSSLPTEPARVAETDFLDEGCLTFVLGDDRGLSTDASRPARIPVARGVEQFVRIASFAHLQYVYHADLSAKTIRLDTKLSDIKGYTLPAGAGADDSLLAVRDLALPQLKDGGEAQRFAQGVFALDEGPFLRGKGVQNALFVGNAHRDALVSRTAGDDAAFAAFRVAMVNAGLLAWQPDGVLLSRGDESGDTAQDGSITARNGLLINTAVHGPAITNAFAVNGKQLDVLPGDKVFLCIVADCWHKDAARVSDTDITVVEQRVADTADINAANARTRADARAAKAAEIAKAVTETQKAALSKELATLEAAHKQAEAAARKATIKDIVHVYARRCDPRSPDAKAGTAVARKARAAYVALCEAEFAQSALSGKDAREAFASEAVVELAKTGGAVAPTLLTNFRLIKTTSAQMIETSFAGRAGAGGGGAAAVSARCRMGLRRSASVSEVVLGGWCIGTVVDTRAVRAAVAGPRLNPNAARSAMRISVAIKFWSGDRLWRTFMNREGSVVARGQMRTDEGGPGALAAPINKSGRLEAIRLDLNASVEDTRKARMAATKAAEAARTARSTSQANRVSPEEAGLASKVVPLERQIKAAEQATPDPDETDQQRQQREGQLQALRDELTKVQKNQGKARDANAGRRKAAEADAAALQARVDAAEAAQQAAVDKVRRAEATLRDFNSAVEDARTQRRDQARDGRFTRGGSLFPSGPAPAPGAATERTAVTGR